MLVESLLVCQNFEILWSKQGRQCRLGADTRPIHDPRKVPIFSAITEPEQVLWNWPDTSDVAEGEWLVVRIDSSISQDDDDDVLWLPQPRGRIHCSSGDLGRMKFAKCSIFTPRLSLHPAALQHCSACRAVNCNCISTQTNKHNLDSLQYTQSLDSVPEMFFCEASF